MAMVNSNQDQIFLSNVMQEIPPAHVALLLRLIRLYPNKIVDDYLKREIAILAIVNEVTGKAYTLDIWPKIMSINRVPALAEQFLIVNEDECLSLAIQKLQLRFELQPHRFLLDQLIPNIDQCHKCKKHFTDPEFHEIGQIIRRENISSCMIYKYECCQLIYTYGYVRNCRTRERFVTLDAIFKQKYIHLFDRTLYARELLVSFTNLLHEAATNFQSFTNAVTHDMDQAKTRRGESSTGQQLNSRHFSATWSWFEISRYLFFMTDYTIVQIPDVTQRTSHDLYYENNSVFFYELFVKFWSRHDQVDSCECQRKSKCLLNFVFDTHMKAHRLVCRFTGLCDESIPEMGPVAIGCPRPPLRSSSKVLRNLNNTDKEKSKYYCEQHYKYGLDMNDNFSNSEKSDELEDHAEQFDSKDICTVHRDNDDRHDKRRTAGFMAIVSNCNVIIGWAESVRAEGMRRWVYQLLKILHLNGHLPEAAAYDSACTFVAYLKNQYEISIKSSPFVDELLRKRYCIDRFHRRNHVRKECKTILACDYYENQKYFEGENTQVCEQLFSHYTKLKAILRSINWPYSTIFYCIIFHIRNCLKTRLSPDNPHLAAMNNIPSPINRLKSWTQVMAVQIENRTITTEE